MNYAKRATHYFLNAFYFSFQCDAHQSYHDIVGERSDSQCLQLFLGVKGQTEQLSGTSGNLSSVNTLDMMDTAVQNIKAGNDKSNAYRKVTLSEMGNGTLD